MIGYDKPDWVLLGVRDNQQYAVIASTQLGIAELEEIRDDLRDLNYFDTPFQRPKEFQLTATMRQFTIAFGDSYGEALAKVMGTWNPDEKTGLPSGAPALGPGPAKLLGGDS